MYVLFIVNIQGGAPSPLYVSLIPGIIKREEKIAYTQNNFVY